MQEDLQLVRLAAAASATRATVAALATTAVATATAIATDAAAAAQPAAVRRRSGGAGSELRSGGRRAAELHVQEEEVQTGYAAGGL